VQPATGGDPVIAIDRTIDPARHPEEQRWITQTADLSAFMGQSITLSFITRPGPVNNFTSDGGFWAEPHFVEPNLTRYTPVFSGKGGNTIFRNEQALPRAFLVGNVRVVQDDDAAWQAVADPKFDPRAAVILTQSAPQGYTGSGRAQEPGEVTITKYGLNDVTAQYTAKEQSMLVLSDAYDKGWSASIDGKKVPLYKAYYNLRAIMVPEGSHTVTFSYRPSSFMIGATVTGTTLIGTTALMAVPLILRRRRRRLISLQHTASHQNGMPKE
jgi:hypothetical protein